ncbi:MFS transporter [Acerihabitans arboris]|uniref:MFS transporter n=1 Tax=Acerihabitans arboris TaxID=2691583 RepID=A0A845SF39_9GAMM|nr:MFS transporter [Acerihabitans arboris]NDL62022.1 MFS transporter [Acerihabitans arboris]
MWLSPEKKRAGRKLRIYNVILLAAFITLALNLRAPLTSLPSAIADIRAGLGISSGLAGVLTAIPVFCFGILTPFASLILAKVSIERAIFITLCAIVLGTLLRSAGGLNAIFAGTFVLGAALTLGNIVCLMVIARDFSRRSDLMTGVYVMAMSVGAMLSSAFTAPLASAFGWRFALASWCILALLAMVLWAGVAYLAARNTSASHIGYHSRPRQTTVVSRGQSAIGESAPANKTASRRPVAWLLAAAFACHTFIFYGMTAWLPDYLVQRGGMNIYQAGFAASLFQILGIVGCFGIPWLRSTMHFSHARLFLIVAIAWFILPVGLIMAPKVCFLWIFFGGIGAGGGFSVVFMLVMAHATNLDDNRAISSFVQGVGYIVASASPAVIGGLHQLAGDWVPSFILLALVAVLMAASGLCVAGYRH